MGNTKTKKTYEQNVPFNRFKKGKKFIIIMRHGERIDSVDKKSQILPKEDPEAGEVIETRFTKTLGIKVLTSSRVVATAKAGK